MSIISQLFERKITFNAAATQIGQWASNVVAHDPALTAAAGDMLSGLKQAASDALSLADSELGQFIKPVTLTVETALEAALAGATKGMSVPFNPMISHGIDTIANNAKAAVDMWVLETKGKLANPDAPKS